MILNSDHLEIAWIHMVRNQLLKQAKGFQRVMDFKVVKDNQKKQDNS